MLGNEVLIAPVYRQNAKGRLVYLPEDMTQVTWKDCKAEQKPVPKGTQYIEVPEDTVVFFIKKGKSIPFCSKIAQSAKDVDYSSLVKLGDAVPYLLYRDDGYTRDIDLKKNTIEF